MSQITLEKIIVGHFEDLRRIAEDLEVAARFDEDHELAAAVRKAMNDIANKGQVLAHAAAIYHPKYQKRERQRGA